MAKDDAMVDGSAVNAGTLTVKEEEKDQVDDSGVATHEEVLAGESTVVPEQEAEIVGAETSVKEPKLAEDGEDVEEGEGLSKMQIMEDVKEGCDDAQPSSPGHAEQRTSSDDSQHKDEIETKNGLEESNGDQNDNDTIKNDVKEEDVQDTEEQTKQEPPAIEEPYENSDSPNSESNGKRKLDTADDIPIKRLRAEMHDHFASRDRILNEFIEMADCNSLEQIHTFSEQLLNEIKTLNELAKEKEREWNNLIHLRKLKEELLIRMQRKRQVMLLGEKSDYVDMLNNTQVVQENGEDKVRTGMPQSILKANLTGAQRGPLRGPTNGMNGQTKTAQNVMSPMRQQLSGIELNGGIDLRQGKQRPTLDVQSIIADYRQKHPEMVPRRGRRIRGYNSDGSGSQVRQSQQDMSGELGLLLNTISMGRQEGGKVNNNESQGQDNAVSFKDMLLQFAKLSQSERNELIQNAIKPPPPYPEVTVHPVSTTPAAPTNSLLHGILTKSPTKQPSKTSFSPTLARLLTAPERATNNHLASTPNLPNSTTVTHTSNMSISEILCSSKARNEITITPVDSYEQSSLKGRVTEEEETEDSADRLVIDEGSEATEARRVAGNGAQQDQGSDGSDEVPLCQGCQQKPAQFVCAGCGNQWYCSRDCQVSAWDEHSEVCSG